MSIAGALIFLRAGFASLNIYTQVGLITLAGLISNHGTRIGTILTQFVVPAIYMLLARTRQGEAEPVTA